MGKKVLMVMLAVFMLSAGKADNGGDFVVVSDVIPDVILEIRYFSSYNFTGERIPGYEEPIAVMTRRAADSLKAVSDELGRQGYRLKIYDAYRPQKAVDFFKKWAADTADVRMKEYFYPDIDKSVLIPKGYIAGRSSHTRGSTVDLTLFDMRKGKEVDMGSPFDFFGKISASEAAPGAISDSQRQNRRILKDAMVRHGFNPFSEEWWHFTLKDEPYPDTYFEFPVSSRANEVAR